jgi:putative peptidoglycan lipid II flippase
MIACYASGVWAYCAIPVLVRGYYAVGDRMTPAKIGLIAVALNFALNLTLVWPLAENGLALATATAAGVQVALLTITFSRTASRLAWSELRSSFAKSALAAALMSIAVVGLEHVLLTQSDAPRLHRAIQLSLTIVAAMVVYLSTAWLFGMPEPRYLLKKGSERFFE